MTIQTLFNRMALFDNQFDLIVGGDDVARGLIAVNLVQDWFELACMPIAELFQTDQTFTTTAAQEHTTWPANLMRIDSLYLLDANSKQVRELEPFDITGAYYPGFPWPIDTLTGLTANGAPWEYEGQQQGGKIRWSPTPDQVYTIRGYGLWAVADYAAAADTLLYPDSVALTFGPHAAQILRTGLDRDLSAVQGAAMVAFDRIAAAYGKTIHTGPESRVYTEIHET